MSQCQPPARVLSSCAFPLRKDGQGSYVLCMASEYDVVQTVLHLHGRPLSWPGLPHLSQPCHTQCVHRILKVRNYSATDDPLLVAMAYLRAKVRVEGHTGLLKWVWPDSMFEKLSWFTETRNLGVLHKKQGRKAWDNDNWKAMAQRLSLILSQCVEGLKRPRDLPPVTPVIDRGQCKDSGPGQASTSCEEQKQLPPRWNPPALPRPSQGSGPGPQG